MQQGMKLHQHENQHDNPDHSPHHRALHLADLFAQVPIYVLASGLFVLCMAIMLGQGITFSPALVIGSATLYLKSIFLVVLVDSTWALIRHRPEKPTAYLLHRYTNPALRLMARLPLFFVIIAFMPIFSRMKSMIPLFNPYSWDATFIAWDRAIFGTDAWIVLQPLLGYPIITSALSMLYHAWMLLIYPGTLFLLFYSASDSIRHRYFLCFVLIWTVLGIAMATSLASVGPCFLEPILGDPHFAAQMAYLNAANEIYPVLVLHVQGLLLDWYNNMDYGLGCGITAMPSMHVSMAFLFYLAIRHVSRWAGWFFFVFFLITWAASVHLAYHYAVDGLVSVVATWILWVASKYILDIWEKFSARFLTRPAPKQPDTATA